MADLTAVVAATTNGHKLREIADILAPLGYDVVSRDAAGVPDFEIEETGETFEENSFLKAKAIFDWFGGKAVTLADDSGIEVDALLGAPGVWSARFAQRDDLEDFVAAEIEETQAHRSLQDRANNKKLLRLLEGIPEEERSARFVSVITCLMPDRNAIVCRGEVEGRVGFSETGKAGFGYDPLFIPEGYDHSFGLFTSEDKNALSHRGAALKKLAATLAEDRSI